LVEIECLLHVTIHLQVTSCLLPYVFSPLCIFLQCIVILFVLLPHCMHTRSPEANATGVIVCALTWAAMNILSYYQMQAYLDGGAPTVRTLLHLTSPYLSSFRKRSLSIFVFLCSSVKPIKHCFFSIFLVLFSRILRLLVP